MIFQWGSFKLGKKLEFFLHVYNESGCTHAYSMEVYLLIKIILHTDNFG